MLQILLAEDNVGDVMLVQLALETHRIEHVLHIVKDGAEALAFLARMGKAGEPPCPDLMLLDLNLPKADGSEILSEFRKHAECNHVPVIVLTSSDSPKDRTRVAQLGVARYFKKPSDFDAFLQFGAIVREVVEP